MPALLPSPSLVASAIYAAIAGVFLARMVAGLLLTLRLVRAAEPLRGGRSAGYDIRISRDLSAPATFGSIILLPQDYRNWSEAKRLAVLAHEAAHARRGDFYIQIAAALNRAIFWFNPLSWWLQRRLSQLAEAVSDDAALAYIKDRPLYAEILLELSRGAPIGYGAVAMARPATVHARIERILAESSAPLAIGGRARAAFIAAMLPLAAIAASPLAARQSASALTQRSLEHASVGISPASQTDERTAVGPAVWAAQQDGVESTSEPATYEVRSTAPAVETRTSGETPTNRQLAIAEGNPTKTNAAASTASWNENLPSATRPSAQANDIAPSGGRLPNEAPLPPIRLAPTLHQSGKELDAKRTASQLGVKLRQPLAEKSESLSAEIPRIEASETAAVAPDICLDRWLGDYDPSGQRAFLVCRKKRRLASAEGPVAMPSEAAEQQSTIGQPPSATQAASGLPTICFDRRFVAGDPSGQHAFYVCHER